MFLILLLLPLLAFAAPQELTLKNRIVADVQGKTISVYDVRKKMDLYLSRHYPEALSSKESRFQFYTANWKQTLNQMIDGELMLADAEAREVKVSDGDVREEMQQRFGPNVMGTLDKLGLTYEEAKTLTHSEMISERMNWMRVTSKALQRVGSRDIRQVYDAYCKANPPIDQWKYQVLTVRAQEPKLVQTVSLNLDALSANLKQENPDATVTVSTDIEADSKTISKAHLEALLPLEIGSYSPPITQVSKADGSKVVRYFYLKDHIKKEPPTLEQASSQIKEELIQQAITEESQKYSKTLRKRLGFDEKRQRELIPTDFQPFTLE